MILALWLVLSVLIYAVLVRACTKVRTERIHAIAVELVAVSLAAVVVMIRPDSQAMLAGLAGLLVLYEGLRRSRHALARESQQIELYQMFSFINNQVRAGLPIDAVLVSLHEATADPRRKEMLRKLGWAYGQSHDLDRYLAELGKIFSPEEFDTIEQAIRNSVVVGMNEQALTFQEDMMFNRYIGIIRKRGERYKLKMMGAGIWLSAAFVLLVGYPFYLEFMSSLGNIY